MFTTIPIRTMQLATRRRAWSDLLYDYEAGEWVIFCKACGRLTGYAPTRKIAIRERLKHTRQQCLGGYWRERLMNDTTTAQPTINDIIKQDMESATGLDLMSSLVDLSKQLIRLTNDNSTTPMCGDCLQSIKICGCDKWVGNTERQTTQLRQ